MSDDFFLYLPSIVLRKDSVVDFVGIKQLLSIIVDFLDYACYASCLIEKSWKSFQSIVSKVLVITVLGLDRGQNPTVTWHKI